MKETNWKGIPSRCGMYFPEKGGRKFGNKIWEQGFRWSISDLMEFLFPSERMPIFHEVGTAYVKFLLENDGNDEADKKEFCKKTGYSLNTLRKNIIPKLYRFGLIHRTRELPKKKRWNIKSKRRSCVRESLQFTTMLRKMAGEWEAIVNIARSRRQILENKQGNREKEIQRLEHLGWERWRRSHE